MEFTKRSIIRKISAVYQKQCSQISHRPKAKPECTVSELNGKQENDTSRLWDAANTGLSDLQRHTESSLCRERSQHTAPP
jgi:hypothetical protein